MICNISKTLLSPSKQNKTKASIETCIHSVHDGILYFDEYFVHGTSQGSKTCGKTPRGNAINVFTFYLTVEYFYDTLNATQLHHYHII